MQCMPEDFFYGIYNFGMAFGTIENAFHYEPSPNVDGVMLTEKGIYSVTDTGSSALIFTSLYFESIVREIFSVAGIRNFNHLLS